MITLIGKKLAKKGLIFEHNGTNSKCQNCRFKSTCVDSLEEGRFYIITEVKNTTHKCELHDEHIVHVVNVEKAPRIALINSKKAFEGSNISLDYNDCGFDCKMHELCYPNGIYPKDKCKIVKIENKLSEKCYKNYDLTKVILKL